MEKETDIKELDKNDIIAFRTSNDFVTTHRIVNIVINENGKCVDNCNSTINYTYEYNGKCYSSCPKGTLIKIII